MSREQSDREESMVETEVVPVDDETEVEFCLPRGADPRPDQIPKDVLVVTGAAGAEANTRKPAQTQVRLV